MIIKRQIASLLVVLAVFNYSFSNPLTPGNIAFEKGDFQEAYRQYNIVLDNGIKSFELFHNLGTTAAKLEKMGEARLFLEKALLIKPGNQETRENIKWIKTELSENIAPLPEFLPQVYWRSISAGLNTNTWYYLSFFSLLLAAFFLWKWLFKQETRSKRKILQIAFILSLAFGLLFVLLGNSRSQQFYSQQFFVVMEEMKHLIAEPEEGAEIIQEIAVGSKVELESELGDWAKVIVEDGSKGWISNKGLSIIEL